MLRKQRKFIYVILAILLVGLLLWGLFFIYPTLSPSEQDIETQFVELESVPQLSTEGKELVWTEYFNRFCQGEMATYREQPLIWYDENGHIEKNRVWRYVGTYGDCYAFLVIGDNKDMDNFPTQDPYPLLGLSRNVYYPNEAIVYLYHTKREFSSDEAPWLVDGATMRLEILYMITENRDKWLTEEQLEQLTQDIEKIAKDYN